MATLISGVVVLLSIFLIGRKLRISPRYERRPRELNLWSSLDKGIDPSDVD